MMEGVAEIVSLWSHCDPGLLVGFMLLPALLAFLAEYQMCRKGLRRSIRLIPVYVAAVVAFAVVLNQLGFVDVFLIGSVICLLMGTLLGFLAAKVKKA